MTVFYKILCDYVQNLAEIDNSRFITYIELLSTQTLLFWVALSCLSFIILQSPFLHEAVFFEREGFVNVLKQ